MVGMFSGYVWKYYEVMHAFPVFKCFWGISTAKTCDIYLSLPEWKCGIPKIAIWRYFTDVLVDMSHICGLSSDLSIINVFWLKLWESTDVFVSPLPPLGCPRAPGLRFAPLRTSLICAANGQESLWFFRARAMTSWLVASHEARVQTSTLQWVSNLTSIRIYASIHIYMFIIKKMKMICHNNDIIVIHNQQFLSLYRCHRCHRLCWSTMDLLIVHLAAASHISTCPPWGLHESSRVISCQLRFRQEWNKFQYLP